MAAVTEPRSSAAAKERRRSHRTKIVGPRRCDGSDPMVVLVVEDDPLISMTLEDLVGESARIIVVN